MKQEKKQVPTYRNKYISTTEFERRTAGFVKGNLRGNGLHSSIIQELSRDKYIKQKLPYLHLEAKSCTGFLQIFGMSTE